MISETGLFTPIYIFSCQVGRDNRQFSYCLSCNGEELESKRITSSNSAELHKKVWDVWLSIKIKYYSVKFVSLDVFPHLTNFFRDCVLQDHKNKFKGPTPIHDLSLLMRVSLLHSDPLEQAKDINKIFYSLCLKKSPLAVKNNKTIFSFDVESWGLYGPPFWIAYTILINNKEHESGHFFCDPKSALTDDVEEKDKTWVEEHVIPHTSRITQTHRTSGEILKAFGDLWMSFSEKYPKNIVIGKRVFPIETTVMVKSLKSKTSSLPQNIIDVQSIIETAGIRERTIPRVAPELPIHHPLGDARYAARLFKIAQSRSKFRNKSLSC